LAVLVRQVVLEVQGVVLVLTPLLVLVIKAHFRLLKAQTEALAEQILVRLIKQALAVAVRHRLALQLSMALAAMAQTVVVV